MGRLPLPLIVLLAFLLVSGALSLVTNSYILTILIFSNIFAVSAASWDLLAGYAGQLSFGNVAFYGVGAYTVGILHCIGSPLCASYIILGSLPSNPWLSNPIVEVMVGGLVAILLSFVIGFAGVRLSGPYLALATFAVALVLQHLVTIYASITGGNFGLTVGPLFPDIRYTYAASLLLLVLAASFMLILVNSRYGLYFKAIRDDQTAAQAVGINPTKYKLLAFATSAFLTSVAGSFAVFAFGVVNSDVLGYNNSLLWIEMSVTGGSGTVVGAIIGSYFIQSLTELLRLSHALSLLIFSILFILVVRFSPGGLLGLLKRLLRRGVR